VLIGFKPGDCFDDRFRRRGDWVEDPTETHPSHSICCEGLVGTHREYDLWCSS
jgi:hypothetical protein